MVTNRVRKSFGSHRKNFQILLRWLAPLTFLICIQAFRDQLRGELPHVQIFMNVGPNPLTWDAESLSYWFNDLKLKTFWFNRSEAHFAFKFSYRNRIKWHGCCVGLYPYVNTEWKNAMTKMSRRTCRWEMFRRVPVRSGANALLHYDVPAVGAYEFATPLKLWFHDTCCVLAVRCHHLRLKGPGHCSRPSRNCVD
jgi:hypothetical protein